HPVCHKRPCTNLSLQKTARAHRSHKQLRRAREQSRSLRRRTLESVPQLSVSFITHAVLRTPRTTFRPSTRPRLISTSGQARFSFNTPSLHVRFLTSINDLTFRRIKMRYALYVAFALVAALLVTAPLSAADARNYRVVEGRQHQILEAKKLYIFLLDVLVRKGATERNYFFSVGPTGDIKPLTITNLKNAFPNNH